MKTCIADWRHTVLAAVLLGAAPLAAAQGHVGGRAWGHMRSPGTAGSTCSADIAVVNGISVC
jgi:hypothetical protein